MFSGFLSEYFANKYFYLKHNFDKNVVSNQQNARLICANSIRSRFNLQEEIKIHFTEDFRKNRVVHALKRMAAIMRSNPKKAAAPNSKYIMMIAKRNCSGALQTIQHFDKQSKTRCTSTAMRFTISAEVVPC